MSTEGFTPRFHSSREISPKYEEAHVYPTVKKLRDADIVSGIAFLVQSGAEGNFIVKDYEDYIALVIGDTLGINYIRSSVKPNKVWVRNSADFEVLANRANHHGVQAMDTITGLETALEALSSAIGDPESGAGISGIVGFLTNESHTLAASAEGEVLNYTGASGKMYIFYGLSDVTESFTVSVVNNPQNLAVSLVGSNYAILGGLDLGETSASVTFEAEGSGIVAGVKIRKTFTLSKSRSGSDSKLLFLTTDRQTMAFNAEGNPQPAVQTIHFSAARQNTTAEVSWLVQDALGNPRVPTNSYLTIDPDTGSATMTIAQFVSACNGQVGIIVTAQLVDTGLVLTDKISIVRVQAGANGIDGEPGQDGIGEDGKLVEFIFKRAATKPDRPTGNGIPATWFDDPPSGVEMLWMSTAKQELDGTLIGIWSDPIRFDGIDGRDGVNGIDGENGYNIRYAYKLSANQPSSPTGNGIPATWSDTPLTGFDPLWMTSCYQDFAGNLVSGSYWTIPIRWSSLDGIDGQDGVTGDYVEFIWKMSATKPATPTGNGIPLTWSDDPPTGSEPLWMSKSRQTWEGTLVSSWTEPVRHTGPKGDKGDQGNTGSPGGQGIPGPSKYTHYAYSDSPDGSLNFTTGAPGTRTYQGIAANKNSEDESQNPGDYQWSTYRGPMSFGMVNQNGMLISGNKIIKTGTNSEWGAGAYSTEAWVNGAVVTFSAGQTNAHFMLGLGTNPALNSHWDSINFVIYCNNLGGINIRESGTTSLLAEDIPYTINDRFSIHYDGKVVRYYMNATLLREVVVAQNLKLYVDSSFYTPNGVAILHSFMPTGAIGAQGNQGNQGTNTTRVILYRRAATAPTKVSVSSTFDFTSGVLTGHNNSWTQAMPANDGNILWAIAASASSQTNTDTIGAAEWSDPIALVQDGSQGPAGLSTYTAVLYRRLSFTPSKPINDIGYTFSTKTFNNLNNGWTDTVPTNDGNPLWVIRGTAATTGDYDVITPSEWSNPSILVQNGVNGNDGENGSRGANAIGFSQDSPTPSAEFEGQLWYRPTPKEWYRAGAVGPSNWTRVFGDLANLSIITEAYIADLSVVSAKIRDAAITSAKIGDLQVTNSKIGNASVDRAKIIDGEIVRAKIGLAAIDEARIENVAVTNAKIRDAAINRAKIQDLEVVNGKIDNLAVNYLKIGNQEVIKDKIEDNSINLPYITGSSTGANSLTNTSPVVRDTIIIPANTGFNRIEWYIEMVGQGVGSYPLFRITREVGGVESAITKDFYVGYFGNMFPWAGFYYDTNVYGVTAIYRLYTWLQAGGSSYGYGAHYLGGDKRNK